MIKMSTEQYKAMRKNTNKQSKYRNKRAERVLENGKTLKFDSLKEAVRYDELMLLLKAGEIIQLRLQPEFTLQEGYVTPQGEKVKPIKYKADFSYVVEDGNIFTEYKTVVEDVKGMKTKEYCIKYKLFLEKYGFSITEI